MRRDVQAAKEAATHVLESLAQTGELCLEDPNVRLLP